MRRTSIFPSQLMPPPQREVFRDPRQIRDKQFMAKAQETIIEFLIQRGYNHLLSRKTLLAPTKKDFESVFKFLYSRIDPHYTYGKRIEDDVYVILRQHLKYPFADSISKSSLHAVGSVKTWPTLLAMLHWMVELLMIAELMDVEMANDENDKHNMYSEFIRAFKLKQSGATDEDIERDMRSRFKEEDERMQNEMKEQEEQIMVVDEKIRNAEATESVLRPLQQKYDQLEHEKFTVEEKVNNLTQENRRLLSLKRDLELEHSELGTKVAELSNQKRELDTKLKAQEISYPEAEQMAKEKQSLMSEISQKESRLKATLQQCREKDARYQQAKEHLEHEISEYNEIAREISFPHLISQCAEPSDLAALLQKNDIRPALTQLRADLLAEESELQRKLSNLNEKIELTNDENSDRKKQIEALELEIKAISVQTRARKSKHEQNIHSFVQATDKLELEIKDIKDQKIKDLIEWENKAQLAEMEYDRAQKALLNQREMFTSSMKKHAEEILDFQEFVKKRMLEVLNEAKDHD